MPNDGASFIDKYIFMYALFAFCVYGVRWILLFDVFEFSLARFARSCFVVIVDPYNLHCPMIPRNVAIRLPENRSCRSQLNGSAGVRQNIYTPFPGFVSELIEMKRFVVNELVVKQIVRQVVNRISQYSADEMICTFWIDRAQVCALTPNAGKVEED